MGRTAPQALLSFTLFFPVALLVSLDVPCPAGRQDPAWLKDVPSLPVHTPPFEASLTEGTPVRMRVEPGKAYRAHAGGVRIYRLRDGGIEDMAAGAPGGWVYLYHSRVENDELVFVPREASELKVESGEMTEQPLAGGEELSVPIEPGVETVGRFVNLDDGESVCVYEFYRGEEVPMEVPVEYRTITLHGAGDWSQKSWEADADRIVLQVRKGRVQVKAGQPFPR